MLLGLSKYSTEPTWTKINHDLCETGKTKTKIYKSYLATSKKMQGSILPSISWSDITADFGLSRRLD